ncbi:hypothetical protein Nepgr_010856 [Nepenthes gracilis]|uniref:Uncharacterized protein n=1 Tax=Nepenthes gracilis TaxID=150966 RepID=A0AAD3XLT7_NEPGR|nr:hypothetical protein Nepgr_010856 [Nepenthes gracilis]
MTSSSLPSPVLGLFAAASSRPYPPPGRLEIMFTTPAATLPGAPPPPSSGPEDRPGLEGSWVEVSSPDELLNLAPQWSRNPQDYDPAVEVTIFRLVPTAPVLQRPGPFHELFSLICMRTLVRESLSGVRRIGRRSLREPPLRLVVLLCRLLGLDSPRISSFLPGSLSPRVLVPSRASRLRWPLRPLYKPAAASASMKVSWVFMYEVLEESTPFEGREEGVQLHLIGRL